MKLLIIGTGYVGLVTGACFAEMGHSVLCLDINREKIDALRRGEIPIYEPGLEEIVERGLKSGRLTFTTSYDEAMKEADVCFFAVDTPNGGDGTTSLQSLKSAVESVATRLKKHTLLVAKSTVPIGTCHKIAAWTKASNPSASFDVVSNPEFLKEGDAVHDFMKPDRVVVGIEREEAGQIMRKIYAPFMLSHERLIIMDILSAEMTKYAANAMLATRISFMNELATLCELTGADINHVRVGIGSDVRIGFRYLYPGIGFGGSCLPKDIASLEEQAKRHGFEMRLLHAVREVNERQKARLGEKIEQYFSSRGGLKGKTIALWGLSFKPETDDLREAPSLTLIEQLLQKGAHVRAFDPVAMDKAKLFLKGITFAQNEMEAAEGADAIALLTEWKQFRLLDFTPILTVMKGRAFFDGRNQYKASEMEANGFDYFPVGAGTILANTTCKT